MIGYLIDANKTADGLNKLERAQVIDSCVDDIMTVCLVWDNMVKQTCSMFMFLEQTDPGVQEKLFKELREVQINTAEDLLKLEFTEKCLLEALRMGPALLRGTRDFRVKEGGDNLGTYKLTKGTGEGSLKIFFSEYVMHHNSTYWTNPKTIIMR